MRTRFLLIACAALGAALTAAAAMAADPHHEKRRLTKADMALAARLVLRDSDLGSGWTSKQPTSFDQSDDTKCPGFDPDFSRFTITGRARSAFSQTAGAQVKSEVEVFKTAGDARADFQLGAKPILARCLSTLAVKGAQAAGVDMRVVTAKMVPAPRLGEQAAMYRFAFEVAALGQRVPLYIDVLAFRQGRIVASLLASSGLRPLPGELDLAQKLAARASG